MTERLAEIKYNGIVSRKKEETGISCSTYCDSCSQGGGNCKYVGEMVKKLAEYETAEEEGRLVALPCDTVYFIWNKNSGKEHVRAKSILDLYLHEITGIDKDGRYWSSKEKAEKALEDMKTSKC